MDRQGHVVIVLVFVGAALGIVAAANPETVPPLVKLVAGAIAAGCASVLALLRPPGSPPRVPPNEGKG